MTPIRQPIENAGLNEVLVRVAYRLVVADYRRAPEPYRAYAPSAVLALAEELRADGFSNLYWTLNGCARWLASGCSLLHWAHEASTERGTRAFHKRRRAARA